MVTKSIIQKMKQDTTLVSLVGSASLMFAEHGQGDKTLVVKENGKTRIDEIAPIKTSRIQIIVSGWDIETGEAISKRALAVLEGLMGQTLVVAGVSQYLVKTIVVDSEPTLIEWKDANYFSANTRVSYAETSTT